MRIALGADRRNVLALILGRGSKLVAFGLLLGLGGSIAATRVLTNMLYEIKPTDPATFAAVVALLALVAVAANYVPARRAMRVNPVVALRHD